MPPKLPKFVRTKDLYYLVKNAFGLRHLIRGAGPAADLLVDEGLMGPLTSREDVYQELKSEGFVQTYDANNEFLGQIDSIALSIRVREPKKKGVKG